MDNEYVFMAISLYSIITLTTISNKETFLHDFIEILQNLPSKLFRHVSSSTYMDISSKFKSSNSAVAKGLMDFSLELIELNSRYMFFFHKHIKTCYLSFQLVQCLCDEIKDQVSIYNVVHYDGILERYMYIIRLPYYHKIIKI